MPRLRRQGMGGGDGAVVTREEFVVDGEEERVDVYLAGRRTGLTRSQVRRLTDRGYVVLNGVVPKASRKLRPGDRILVTVPPPVAMDLAPEVMPVNVVYQDEDLLVIDKPAGIPVHPSPGHPSHTLVNGLLALCPDLKGIGGVIRPGIVHRLDKDTSGLMVVAKSSRAHLHISAQIKARTVRKGYLALASGRVEPSEGIIEAAIGRDPRNRKRMAVVPEGRQASTWYRVLKYFSFGAVNYSYLEVFPKTGRTHQIRVHFASMGHPLAGDALYGNKRAPVAGAGAIVERQFLHANVLEFRHPVTEAILELSCPLAPDLERALGLLENMEKTAGSRGRHDRQ